MPITAPTATTPVGVTYVNGTLYVVAEAGDANGYGAVYAFNPTTGARSTVYSFTGKADGGYPAIPLLYVNGVLVGASQSGGQYSHGTIYELTPGGTETTIHAFGAKAGGGQYPSGILVASGSGEVFGTTEAGGTAGADGRRDQHRGQFRDVDPG